MSIAGGFFGTLANNIKDKREFIRSRVEEDRTYLRQQGLQRQAQVAEQKARYEMATEQLMRIDGVDRNRVLAALEADPNGILDLAGRDLTNPNEINTVLDLYEGQEATGNLSEILGRVMPAFSSLPAEADPTTVRRTGVAAWLGLDTETELNQEVYSSQIVGGMTGDQILASMNIPVTAKGTGALGMNYAGIDPGEQLDASERRFFYSDMALTYDERLDGKIAALRAQEAGASMEEKKQFMEEIKRLEGLKDGPDASRLPKLIQEFGVDDNTRQYFETYGNRLFDPTFGFNPSIMNMLTPQEDLEETQGDGGSPPPAPEVTPEVEPILTVDTEEQIQSTAEEYKETHPDASEVTIKVGDNEPVTIPLRVEVEEYTPTTEYRFGDSPITGKGGRVTQEPTPGSYRVVSTPEGDAENILSNSGMTNMEKLARLEAIKKYLESQESTLDTQSSLDFINPYIQALNKASDTPPNPMSTTAPAPLPIPRDEDLPKDVSEVNFPKYLEETIIQGQRRVLEGGRIDRFQESRGVEPPLFQGRPDIAAVLFEDENIPVDPDFVQSVFDDLGIQEDSTFGMNLANMLLRDFKPEERKTALQFIINQYDLFRGR